MWNTILIVKDWAMIWKWAPAKKALSSFYSKIWLTLYLLSPLLYDNANVP